MQGHWDLISVAESSIKCRYSSFLRQLAVKKSKGRRGESLPQSKNRASISCCATHPLALCRTRTRYTDFERILARHVSPLFLGHPHATIRIQIPASSRRYPPLYKARILHTFVEEHPTKLLLPHPVHHSAASC